MISIFDNFTKVSGLAINKDTSDALWVGSLKDNDYCVGDVKWKLAPNNVIKILGVTFSPSISTDNIECNWISKMKSIEQFIRAWKMRGLSMTGC